MELGLKELFKSVKIFETLTEGEIVDIIHTSSTRVLKPGEVLFEAGQAGNSMFVIEEGSIRLFHLFPDGSREVLATLSTGEVVGEMAILDDSPRSARAVAVGACRLCEIARQDFDPLREAFHPAAYKVIRSIAMVLSVRMRDTNRRLVSFFEDPEASLTYLKQRRQSALR